MNRTKRLMKEHRLAVAPRAALGWLPQETICYVGCHAMLANRIALAPGARFIGWKVLCLGRPAASERFDAGSCRHHIE